MPGLATDPIGLRDVDVALGGRPILRDITLRVAHGEVVALLGANGSGKSTLVKTMVGLHPASRGTVELFGTPLPRFEQWSRLGYVPQRSHAAPGIPATVREVVGTGRVSRRRPFVPMSRADRRAIDRAIETVGLTDKAQSHVGTLSGGQHQRVLIARGLAGEPELLLLDEPNAGVDLASQLEVATAVERLVAQGATVVVVLHELGPLAPLIQRCVVLQEGRIAFDGDPEQLSHHDHGHHHGETTSLRDLPMTAPLEADRP